MILCYFTCRLQLCGLSERHSSTTNLDLVDQVLQALKVCAESDPVARNFAGILLTHQAVLRQHCRYTPDLGSYRFDDCQPARERASSDAGLCDVLLDPFPGRSPLHATSITIVNQLSHPHADTDDWSLPKKDHQAEMPLGDRRIRVFSFYETCQHLMTSFSNMEDGYFVDSHQPSGWLPQRSPKAYV